MEYHCLIASLGQISLDDTRGQGGVDFRATLAEILEELTPRDRAYAQTLYSYFDVLNILGQMSRQGDKGQVANQAPHNIPHNLMGQLSAKNIALLLGGEELPEDTLNPLPQLVLETIEIIQGREEPTEQIPVDSTTGEGEKEMLLLQNFYESCRQSHCKFLRAWAQSDKGIRTICADIQGQTTIDPETTDMAKDAPWYTELTQLLKISDFVEREHAMDKLRWTIADELVQGGGISETAHTSDINAVLCYLVQLNIIERWASLSKENGRKKFEEMVNSFSEQGKL